MDAEEIDFGTFEDGGADAEGDRDAGDEGDEFAGFGGADADVPLFAPARRFEGPVLDLMGKGIALDVGVGITSLGRKRSS